MGSAIKTAVFLSSLPQSALRHDLNNLHGCISNKFDHTNEWQHILADIKSSMSLNEEALKSLRISKLNNMSEWELDEIEREQNHLQLKQKPCD